MSTLLNKRIQPTGSGQICLQVDPSLSQSLVARARITGVSNPHIKDAKTSTSLIPHPHLRPRLLPFVMTDHNYLAPAAGHPVAGAGTVPAPVAAALADLGGAVDLMAAHASAVLTAPLSELPNAMGGVVNAADSVHAMLSVLSAAIKASAAPPAAAPPAAAPALQAPPAPPAATSQGFIHTAGPWTAGLLYGVVPPSPLTAVPDNGGKWFAITRGKYIGLTQNSAISLNAVTGISTGLSEKFATQTDALAHFNDALHTHALAVVA
ncbi:hypothetical protein C8R46DRAFT_1233197 [Mycena filopes]|nr:hypothetical protein C8R46DRAFT_1233197 [Mycena filopes]